MRSDDFGLELVEGLVEIASIEDERCAVADRLEERPPASIEGPALDSDVGQGLAI